MKKINVPIGQVLLEDQLITQEQLDEALQAQKHTQGKRLGEVLIDLGFVGEREMYAALAKRLKLPYIDLSVYPVNSNAVRLVKEELAQKYTFIPILQVDNMLTVAMSDPMNFFVVDEITFLTGLEVNTVISTPTDIQNAINRFYSTSKAWEAAEDVQKEYTQEEILELSEQITLEDDVEHAPVVRLVNSIVFQGAKLGASDIHIEPFRDSTRIRMRIDGTLHDQMTISNSAHGSIITRLKILGGMNIAERRVPQDGRFETMLDGRPIDLRLSSLPTVHGEKMVIRILNSSNDKVKSKSQLGLLPHNAELFDKLIQSPNGIILVTGPTGSGKTTTLYTILDELNQDDVNIITVEDPVERKIPGINQVQINMKAGLTFASGLRSILRQDPNIIMIGEIRDGETAAIATRAAITGHLVLSTIHTNDSASTIARLADMGVERYLIASSVVAIIAQRLARVLCPDCKTPYQSTDAHNKLLGIDQSTTLYKKVGCPRCNNTGYKGRKAIHEIMLINSKLRDLIARGAETTEIRTIAVENGMLLLRENMVEFVLNGETSLEELIQITYSFD